MSDPLRRARAAAQLLHRPATVDGLVVGTWNAGGIEPFAPLTTPDAAALAAASAKIARLGRGQAPAYPILTPRSLPSLR